MIKTFKRWRTWALGVSLATITLGSAALAVTGDFDNDGDVDRDDITILLTEIRSPGPHDPAFDINGDGVVNRADARTIVGLCTRPRCEVGPGGGGDTTPPVVTPPADIIVAAVDAIGTPKSDPAIQTFVNSVTTIDDTDGPLPTTNNAPDVFPLGSTPVEFSATDAAGNTGSASALVTVQDLTPPVVTAPANIGVTAPDEIGIPISDPTVQAFLNSATAVDNVDGSISVPAPANLPAIIPIGTTLVTFEVIDAAGNTASVTAQITVSQQIDLIPPVVNVPKDISVLAVDANGTPKTELAIQTFLDGATAEDDVDGSLTPTNNAPDVFPLGPTTVTFTAEDAAGNSTSATAMVTVLDGHPPEVKIIEPANLSLLPASPVKVSGTVDDETNTVKVNGTSVSLNGQSWSAIVPLQEGKNTITAVANDPSGNVGTASVQVTLDTTPPMVVIESPTDGSTTNNAQADVAGMINDIVVGTVTSDKARVSVNGVEAEVDNRSFFARGVPLLEGNNTITAMGEDEVGNVGVASIQVTRTAATGNRIELVSGQDQRADIQSVLPDPLQVKLADGAGNPVANKNVIYRVILGDGKVGVGTPDEAQGIVVTTDANGMASTRFRLGSRAGTGIHRVQAKAVGVEGEIVFLESADPQPGDKINVIDGNNQLGVVGQPLPEALVVAVTDAGANLIANAEVEFKATQGGGTFENGETTFRTTTNTDGRASALFTLGPEVGFDVHRVAAKLVGATALAGFSASGLVAGDPGQTTISGVVLDNQDNPIPGVTIRVDGTNLQAVADTQGQFKITNAPVGAVHLIADGTTATVQGPWPTLSFNIVTVPGADNPLPSPIYLVKLDTANAKTVGLEAVEFTLPEVPGFKLTVKAGSVTFLDGSTIGQISVTPVNANKVPMPPPNGMQPQFIVTIQPAGTIFNPPASLTLPNVDGHAPGAQVEMYSFDHDLEEFVTIGVGTVSQDGSVIESNPGVGVIKAGWHCGSQPGGTGCTHDCPQCSTCKELDCICDDPVPGACDDGNPCTLGDTCTGLECGPGEPAPDGLPCDVGGDGCTIFICENGGCTAVGSFTDGTPCNDDGNQCTTNVCREGICTHDPTPGAPCDDGLHCTIDDNCNGDQCQGLPTDEAICSESSASNFTNQISESCFCSEPEPEPECEDIANDIREANRQLEQLEDLGLERLLERNFNDADFEFLDCLNSLVNNGLLSIGDALEIQGGYGDLLLTCPGSLLCSVQQLFWENRIPDDGFFNCRSRFSNALDAWESFQDVVDQRLDTLDQLKSLCESYDSRPECVFDDELADICGVE